MTKSVFSGKYDGFRQLLIDARKKAGLSQAELSTRLSRPQSFVSKYERGERRLDVIEFFEVAEAMGVEPFRFLQALQRSFQAEPSEEDDHA